MPTAVIVDAIRTPLGRRNGKLKDVHPVDLAAHVLKAVVERNGIDPALVEDVIMGCVMQVGEQGINVGRNAALAAGFPETTVGTTIDRQCGSSQQAAHFAAQGVMAGAYDVVIAAGRREHDARADGRVRRRRQVRLPVRSDDDGSLPQPRAAGHLGRADLREVGHLPRRQRRVLGRVAPAGGAGARRGPLRPRDPAGHRARRVGRRGRDAGRGHPARLVDGDARQAQARVQARRCGHRRELVADHRRRGRGADHERGEGERSSASSPAPASTRSRSRASTRC